ncbi:hypothetical protein VTI28DRAFT_9948 [Corynascus sepedonium]
MRGMVEANRSDLERAKQRMPRKAAGGVLLFIYDLLGVAGDQVLDQWGPAEGPGESGERVQASWDGKVAVGREVSGQYGKAGLVGHGERLRGPGVNIKGACRHPGVMYVHYSICSVGSQAVIPHKVGPAKIPDWTDPGTRCRLLGRDVRGRSWHSTRRVNGP